jgi:superfamily II DNA or RNA helicase
MSYSIISRIENYLDIYATSDVRKRGKDLFNANRIHSAQVHKSAGKASFEVQGTYLYNVSINGFNEYIRSECSCPYDWGPVCKHQVAALLYLIDYFGGSKPKEKQVKDIVPKTVKTAPRVNLRLSTIPFLIEDFKTITPEFVRKHNSNISMWGNFKTHLFETNRLHFNVSVSSFYNPVVFNVRFYHKPQGLFTECNCNQKVVSLCPHQYYILSKIANSPHPDIFNLILPGNLKKFKNEILANYGLQGQKFEKYFNLTYENLEIGYAPIDEFKFLIPVSGNEELESVFEESMKKLDNDLIRIEKPMIGVIEDEKRVPGFVFKVYATNSLPFNDELELMIISGKENKSKDKLVSNIKSYDELSSNDHLVLNSHQKDLLEKIMYFENSRQRDDQQDDFTEVQLFYFDILKKIFPMLALEKYVFIESGDHNYGKLRKSDLQPVLISDLHPEFEFEVKENDLFLELVPVFVIKGIKYDFEKRSQEQSHFLFSCISNILFLHKSISQSILISQFSGGKLAMVKTEADKFFQQFIQPVSKHCKIHFETDIYSFQEVTLKPEKRQVFLSEHGDYVVFKAIVIYENNRTIFPGDQGDHVIKDDQGNIIRHIRDAEFESDFLDFMSGLHADFSQQRLTGVFSLDAGLLLENYWFFEAFEKMENAGIEVFGIRDLKSFKYAPYHAKVNTGIKSGQDWFEVDIEVAFGDNRVDLKSIRKAVLNHEKYVRLSDGSIGIMPEDWIQRLERYFRAGDITDDKLKISKLKFSIIDELFSNIDNVAILKELAEKRRRLKEIENIKNVRKPKEITAVLRNYQKEGVNWLNLLNEMGWGGILADDMGLGKTLQILTLIQMQVKKSKKPNLIVVPTTLLFNWEMELKKFAPKLSFHFYYGLSRDKEIKSFKKYQLIFTTYGVMTRDIEFLRNFKFNYAILDESQAIKNPLSLRYKAAFLLQAEHKLTLTGTPIENSTFDLFAQMNFVNPGFLGTVDSFKKQYSIPIDKENNAFISSELNKMIHPFILRRTKEQVAKELPPKTETILFCEMGEDQRRVYDAFRNKYRDKLLKRIITDGLEKSKIYVLEGLTKLRQICDSPAILSDEENYGNQSVKIEELKRHILEKTSNHKILIFSQFVRMLKLIREELNREKIDFEYLDGQSTKQQREDSVNRFQEVAGCRVFLISLKAGGMGLNLTAADYVYLVDPWWNPAVENQAIDRTHRIGQSKNVFAYRMICKNTVEEKILNLQAKKTKIAQDIITTDEGIMKKLTEKDIKELFS